MTGHSLGFRADPLVLEDVGGDPGPALSTWLTSFLARLMVPSPQDAGAGRSPSETGLMLFIVLLLLLVPWLLWVPIQCQGPQTVWDGRPVLQAARARASCVCQMSSVSLVPLP